MSKVLSIYNNSAFFELVLPAASNSEQSFLLDSELFQLPENELIELECVNGKWRFMENISVSSIDGSEDGWLPDYGRFSLTTSRGDSMTILVEEKENPLGVYSKYVLVPGREISIGLDEKNTIRYRFPLEKQVKSFVSHHHCTIVYDGTEAYLKDSSSNGTYINNLRVFGTQRLCFGDNIRIFGLSLVYLGSILASNRPASYETDLAEATSDTLDPYLARGNANGSSAKDKFRRAPRTVPKLNSEAIVIDPPPAPKDNPRVPLFMQIGPAMTMALPMLLGTGMTIVASRTMGSNNSALMYTGIITAVASAFIGTFWAIMNMRFSKKSLVEGEERRFDKYGKYLIDKQDYIENVYNADSAALREKYISAGEIARYDADNEKLWNRNPNHSDFLSYRIGLGEVPFPAPIEVQREKFTMVDDSLEEKPRLIKERFRIMQDVPVCVDLRDKSLIGIIGGANSWAQVVRDLIVQIAGNNSYADVKLAFVFDSNKISNAKSWDFVRWLPHCWSEDRKLRYFATDKNEANEVFFSLGQVMRVRREEMSRYSSGEGAGPRPYYVLIVLNKELLEGELISKYIGDDSGKIGLSTVIVSEQYKGLPNNCEFILENNDAFSGVYSTIDENTDRLSVAFDRTEDAELLAFAKRLANIEIDEAENGGELPNSISFFDMYGISRPEELDSAQRWRKARTAETMKALIGFRGGDSPCYLDIHERYHGPHGLVAGTTGSGKSETLQTYMLSLAVNYSPDDVGFFIIDYKGGGMANLFDGLPHMIGAISNLSGNQVKRAMVSIKSENKRRQRIFSDCGVNNINAYTSLYKNGDAKEPIPHMFIIIDEFAELKREEPDFMRELVSVAQVGRSLGVHLILATQKPAGTVDDNIWSNSKFRLCLRVQDRQDSMDMLHRPDAAYLTQAGRGYLQVGSDEVFELFQSGYSGAAYDEALGDKKLVVAQMLDPVGKIDLVGNHFKIQYQEELKLRWIETLCRAVEKSLSKAVPGRSTAPDDLLYSETFMEDIYADVAEQGEDFKRSQYNDVRIREFIRLFNSLEDAASGERAGQIIDLAIKRGAKLPETRTKTQLEAINEYLARVAVLNGYNNEISLWMPVLPDKLLLTDIEGYHNMEIAERTMEEGQWTLSAIVGKGDDPENQNQMPISIDFANNGHHAICGTVATGKSTFLQTAIYSLINKYSSEELNIYIIDFSSKLLTVFEDAKQIGGIMTDGEEDTEKIAKFFTMMGAIMDERKKLLASTNFRDYVEHSGAKLPAIVVVIDNFASFRDKTDERYEDIIKQLSKEGLSYGIFLIVTAGGFGTSEIPSRLADSFRTTICLEMPDIYQYSDVMRIVRVPIYPESNTKGRGLVYYGEKIIEFQTALACDGDGVFDRNQGIRRQIDRINEANRGKNAPRIPVIPDKPVWEEYSQTEEYRSLLSKPGLIPNGYNAETAAYSAIDLRGLLTYVVNGTKKSGKSNYMKTLIRACADKDSELCIIEIGSSEFSQIASETGAQYVTDGQGIFDFAKSVLLTEAGARAGRKKECLALHMEEAEFFDAMSEYRRICVFIANTHGFLEELYNRESPAFNSVNVYETLAGDKGWHYNFYFFAELGDADLGEALGYPFMQSFKDNGAGIRFGGKYLSQKLFSFVNLPYKIQGNALKPGVGVVPSDDESAPIEQIVVPNYKG